MLKRPKTYMYHQQAAPEYIISLIDLLQATMLDTLLDYQRKGFSADHDEEALMRRSTVIAEKW